MKEIVSGLQVKNIYEFAVDGLLTDRAHHKQWFLQEILKEIGIDLSVLHSTLQEHDYDFEDGIAP